MLSIHTIILEYVCPAMGIIIAQYMFSAPYADVQKAVQRGYLGDLNPLPWIFMLGNCCGWVTYSIIKQNLWIFFGNCPGFILSIYLNLCAVKLLYHEDNAKKIISIKEQHVDIVVEQTKSLLLPAHDDLNEQQQVQERQQKKEDDTIATTMIVGEEETLEMTKVSSSLSSPQRDQEKEAESLSKLENGETTTMPTGTTTTTNPSWQQHERYFMMIVIVWVSCISLVSFGNGEKFTSNPQTKEYIVGILVNMNLVFFYGAPLSTILQVLKTRNSASIHIRTMITNTANGSFWMAYGFAILDPFIYVPNGLGALLGVIQIFLCMTFPRIPIIDGNSNEQQQQG